MPRLRKNGSETERSVLGGDRRRVTAEAEVEADAHNALGLLDIDECRTEPDDLRRQRNRAGPEVVIIVFDEAGHKAGEGIFAADADGPSRPRLARGIGGAEDDGGRPIVVPLPRGTAPDV